MDTSPFERAKDLQVQINKLLSAFDVGSMRPEERETLLALKRQAADVRLDIRDYGMAETAAGQRQLAEVARRRLTELEAGVVKAGTLNLFGPADVALTSALIQQLIADI